MNWTVDTLKQMGEVQEAATLDKELQTAKEC